MPQNCATWKLKKLGIFIHLLQIITGWILPRAHQLPGTSGCPMQRRVCFWAGESPREGVSKKQWVLRHWEGAQWCPVHSLLPTSQSKGHPNQQTPSPQAGGFHSCSSSEARPDSPRGKAEGICLRFPLHLALGQLTQEMIDRGAVATGGEVWHYGLPKTKECKA